MVVAAGLVAAVAVLHWSGIGPVAVASGALVVVGVVLVLGVELISARAERTAATPHLWHPEDFVVHVHRASGRVVEVQGSTTLGGPRARRSPACAIDELLVSPRFASIRDHLPRRRAHAREAFQAIWRAADGSTRRSETVAVVDGAHLVLYGRDVTEASDQMARLARTAITDPLTGLSNRTVLDRSIRSAGARSARTGEGFGVAVIDLDGFKAFNDRHGHVGGDRLLRDVAGALQASCRAGDDLLRMGGDELLLVARELDSWTAAELVAERVLHAVRRTSGGAVTASVGVAVAHGRSVDAPSLVAAADAAMYEAKRAGGDRARVVPVAPRSQAQG